MRRLIAPLTIKIFRARANLSHRRLPPQANFSNESRNAGGKVRGSHCSWIPGFLSVTSLRALRVPVVKSTSLPLCVAKLMRIPCACLAAIALCLTTAATAEEIVIDFEQVSIRLDPKNDEAVNTGKMPGKELGVTAPDD